VLQLQQEWLDQLPKILELNKQTNRDNKRSCSDRGDRVE
jgi:hypothetical protein